MFRRVLLTTSTVLWLWGAYALYSATITPLLQPAPERSGNGISSRDPATAMELPVADNTLAAKYLPDAPWASPREDSAEELKPYQLHFGDNVYLYTLSIDRPGSSEDVSFRPFAMLVLPKGKDGKVGEPTTIVAESATLRFANKFDIHNPPGRIVGGQLSGKVSMRGPNGLSLLGENFIFEERYESRHSILYSDHRVQFTYGPHSGHGRQIEVQFQRLNGAPPADLPAIDGIERIWLRRDVHLKLVDKREKAKEPQRGHVQQASTDTLLVDAAGGLTFDLQQSLIRLEDQVQLVQPTTNGRQNSVDCELLVLELTKQASSRPTPDSAVPATSTAPDSNRFENWLPKRLELSVLTATGNPDNPVRLRSPENKLRAEMRSLQYNLKNRKVILLEEKNDGVHIEQGTYEIRNPEIHLVHGPNNELIHVECHRAGQISSRGIDKQSFRAEWQDKMTKRPSTDVPGEEILELHGQTRLTQPLQRISLESEHLLTGFSLPEGEGLSQKEKAATTPDKKIRFEKSPFPSERVRLHWVNAQEDVRFSHPELTGNTHRLTMNFTESPTPLPRSRTQLSGRASPISPPQEKSVPVANSKPASGKTKPKTVESPEKSTTESVQPSPGDPAPVVTAGEIQVEILRHGDEIHLSEVKGLHHFQMRQTHINGAPPLEVDGEWVQILNRSELDQEVKLHGQPAILKDQGNTISGPQIRFVRLQNYAEVIGPGEFTGPVQSTLDGKALQTPQMLSVKWREKVTFDGQKITFYDRVVGQLDESSMSCPEMIVVLSQPISFVQKTSPKEKDPEVNSLECKHHVVFEQNQFQKGQLGLRIVGEVANFKTEKQTGKTTALGPGIVRVWKLRSSGSKSAGPLPLIQASNRPGNPSEARPWEYQEVRFRNQMQGNFTQRFTTFEGGVQVIYGPVSLPTEMVPLDDLPPNGGTMDCNELQITQQGLSDDESFNLLGKGNVRLEGFGFHARADEINHDQSKSQYILHSRGKRQNVDLWYSDEESGLPKHATGETFDFVVEQGALKRLKGTRMSGIDGTD